MILWFAKCSEIQIVASTCAYHFSFHTNNTEYDNSGHEHLRKVLIWTDVPPLFIWSLQALIYRSHASLFQNSHPCVPLLATSTESCSLPFIGQHFCFTLPLRIYLLLYSLIALQNATDLQCDCAALRIVLMLSMHTVQSTSLGTLRGPSVF